MVDFTVTESDGITRDLWPVKGGLCLPRGALAADGHVCVQNSDQDRLSTQMKPLTYWQDGSIQWAHIIFMTPLGKKQTASFRLIEAEKTDEPLVCPWANCQAGQPIPDFDALFASSVRAVGTKGEFRVVDENDLVSTEKGCVRTRVCVEGELSEPITGARIKWRSVLDFYKGLDWFSCDFTYTLTEADVQLIELSLISQIKPPTKAAFFSRDLAWGEPEPLKIEQGYAEIFQADEKSSHIKDMQGRMLHAHGLKNKGYAGIFTENGCIGTGMVPFWPLFPKSLSVNDHLQIGLWPISACEPLSLKRGSAHTYSLFFAKTKTMKQMDELATAHRTACMPQARLQDRVGSALVRPMLSTNALPYVEQLTRTMFTGFTTFTTRDNAGVWCLGDRHYGDFRAESYEQRGVLSTYGQSGIVYGNHEAQVPYGFFVQYLRTLDLAYFQHGFACARHQADVDVIHDDADPSMIGRQHIHSTDHAYGTACNSHQWVSGLALAWLLTDDDRLHSVLLKSEQSLIAQSRLDPSIFCDREGGWLLISLCALYEVFGRSECKQAAQRVFWGLKSWIEAGAEQLLPPDAWCFSPIMLHIALLGIRDYWQISKDPCAKTLFMDSVRLVIEKGMNDSGFFYTVDGESYRGTERWVLCHSLPVLAQAYRFTEDPHYLRIGAKQARLMLRMMELRNRYGLEDNWAQGGIYFSYAFEFFDLAFRHGFLHDIEGG